MAQYGGMAQALKAATVENGRQAQAAINQANALRCPPCLIHNLSAGLLNHVNHRCCCKLLPCHRPTPPRRRTISAVMKVRSGCAWMAAYISSRMSATLAYCGRVR